MRPAERVIESAGGHMVVDRRRVVAVWIHGARYAVGELGDYGYGGVILWQRKQVQKRTTAGRAIGHSNWRRRGFTPGDGWRRDRRRQIASGWPETIGCTNRGASRWSGLVERITWKAQPTIKLGKA